MAFGEQNGCLYYTSPAAIMGKRKEINFEDCEGYHIFHLRKNVHPEI